MAETMDNNVSINLPRLLLQAFSINVNVAKCMKCNMSCAPKVEDILFHLSVCNGILIEENIQTVFKFNCLKCCFSTDSIDQWKSHLFKLDHISNNFDYDIIRFSYNCNLCKTHFYGFRENILEHQCKPLLLSPLSYVMSYVFGKYNIQDKPAMLHYCTDCSNYNYDLTKLHFEKHSEVADTSVCNSCQITFHGSSNEEFLNHKVSFEHMVLWCLNGARSVPKMSTTAFQNLPYYITKYFVISPLMEKFCCMVCNTKGILKYECIYDHFYNCISSKEISHANSCMPLQSLNCNVCNHSCFSVGKNLYKYWVDHVTSLNHLSKTVVGKKDKYKFFSYYCYVSETLYYGTDSFIKNIIMKTNNDIGRLLFVSDVMAKVYKQVTNTHFSCNILYCCGICQNHTVNKFNCVHKNIDSRLSLYCFTCLVVFNVKSDYLEHLVSSEHIILKYFKSNQLAELKILDHSMKTMKLYLTNLNKSEDDNSDDDDDADNPQEAMCKDNNDTDNPQEAMCEDNNEMITYTENITSYDPEENIIKKLIEQLSAQPIKSAFNNYLRKNFDKLIQNLQESDAVISMVYFCEICNAVLCNRDDWIKHDKEFHQKKKEFWILYCSVCSIYLVSSYINTIDHHLMTMEHVIMNVFKNIIKPSINNINNCNTNSNPTNDDKVFDFNVQIANENKMNKTIYIEIKNVDNKLKKNNYILLSEIIQELYGKFKQVENVNNSFVIFFENKDQVKCICGDTKELENKYGLTIQVIENHHLEKVLSFETMDLFKDWGLLCARILSDLEVMNLTLSSTKIQSRIQQLCDAICSLQVVTDSKQIHIFGSRVYGLATNTTDIDIYLEIGDTFDGEIANNEDIQVKLVQQFAERCQLKPKDFQNVKSICHCRVPIVKFYHEPSKLICDVSFKSGLSVYNTRLIKFYLSMNTSVKWLVCVIVKNWALQNSLKDRHFFTSYALIWLVLFYLMVEKMIPSLIELRQYATKADHKVIEGWDCTFGKYSVNISDDKRPKLLLGFFQYYAYKRALKDHVLSTCTGRLVKKNGFYEKFSQLSGLSKIQRTKFKNFKSQVIPSFEKNYGLVLQDPFDLSFNLTKNLSKQALTEFCDLCFQSSTLLINMEGFNMFSNT